MATTTTNNDNKQRWSIDKALFDMNKDDEDCSHRSHKREFSKDDLPVLELQQFTTPPTVDFGSVQSGQTESRYVRVQNLTPQQRRLHIEKLPEQHGFKLVGVHGDYPPPPPPEQQTKTLHERIQRIIVPPTSNQYIELKWTPTNGSVDGVNVREVIILKLDGRFRLQITLLGKCQKQQQTKQRRRRNNVRDRLKASSIMTKNKENIINNNNNGMNKPPRPQKQQQQQRKNALHRRKPIATTKKKTKMKMNTKAKVFYDEKWAEKQQHSFTIWYNNIVNSLLSSSSSLGLLDIIRMDARLRRHGCVLYHSDEVQQRIYGLDRAISEGQLMIRTDRDINNDIGVKDHILNMLFSVELKWLRLGIECVYGEILDISATEPVGGDVWLNTLQSYLQNNLFRNFDLEDKYTYVELTSTKQYLSRRSNAASSRTFKHGYEEELKKHTLRKFMHLMYFLEVAYMNQIIPNSTRLFNKDAQYKSISDILIDFCKNYISGMGDILRYMQLLGCSFQFHQTEIHELSYTMTNMAVDLRDGVRLTRIAEVLSKNNQSFMPLLRLPASSKTRKIYNVEVALNALVSVGIPIRVNGHSSSTAGIHFTHQQQRSLNIDKHACFTPDEIVDGFRSRSLMLLWIIIHHCIQLNILNENTLIKEIGQCTQLNALTTSTRTTKDSPMMGALYMTNKRLQLLLNWCKVVCSVNARIASKQLGLNIHWNVHNFTSSFCNGEILCAIINFYQPNLLPLTSIAGLRRYKKALIIDEQEDNDDDDDGDGNDTQWSEFYQHKSANDTDIVKSNKKNLRQALSAIEVLGNIPLILRVSDFIDTPPDEKVMIVFISYLFSRLISLKSVSKAALTIQNAWHKYKSRKHSKEIHDREVKAEAFRLLRDRKLKEYEYRCNAAVRIQCAWRVYQSRLTVQRLRRHRELARGKHVEMIMDLSKHMASRAVGGMIVYAINSVYNIRMKEMNEAATCIQTLFRKFMCRRKYLKQIKVIHQAKQQLAMNNMIHSSVMVARNAVHILMNTAFVHVSQHYDMKFNKAVTCLQANWLCFKQQRQYQAYRRRVVQCQSYVRMYTHKKQLQTLKDAVICVENKRMSAIQMRQAQEQLRLKRIQHNVMIRQQYHAATVIQKAFRVYIQQRKHAAIVKIQSIVRSYQVSRKYDELRHSTIVVQSYIRRKYAMIYREKCLTSIVRIQSMYRKYATRKQYKQQYQLIVTMQANARAVLYRRRYHAYEHATICIQNMFCHCQLRRKTKEMLLHVKLQAEMKQKAATTIQLHYKCYKLRQSFCMYYNRRAYACIKLQSTWRMYAQRQKFETLRTHVIKCQSYIRRIQSIKQLKQQHQDETHAAIHIQSQWRCYKERKHYKTMKHVVIRMQAFIRSMLARQYMKQEYNNIIIVQSIARRWLASRYTLSYYSSLLQAVKCITSRYKALKLGRNERESYNALKHATITFESYFRGYRARKYTNELRNEREYAQKLQLIREKHAVRVIGNAYYNYMQQQASVEKVHATHTLQSIVRVFIQQQYTKRKQQAVVLIQSIARTYVCKRCYQHDLHYIRRLQARIRGFLIRKHTTKDVQTCRWKIKRAEDNVTEDKLIGNRTRTALEILLSSKQLTVVGDAIRTLDRVTSLLDSCCVRAVNEGIVDVLLALIQSCNRSKPHLELVRNTLNVLKNLSKSKLASRNLFENARLVEVLSEQMQIYRDINDIFLKCIRILRQGCQYDGYTLYLKTDEATHFKRIQSILKLSKHKVHMNEKYPSSNKKMKQTHKVAKLCVVNLERLVKTVVDA